MSPVDDELVTLVSSLISLRCNSLLLEVGPLHQTLSTPWSHHPLALYSCQSCLLNKKHFHSLVPPVETSMILSSGHESSSLLLPLLFFRSCSLFWGKRIPPTELRALFESWVAMLPTVAPYLPSYWRQRLRKWAFWAFSQNVSIQTPLRCCWWWGQGTCVRYGKIQGTGVELECMILGLVGQVMSWRAFGWLRILLTSECLT